MLWVPPLCPGLVVEAVMVWVGVWLRRALLELSRRAWLDGDDAFRRQVDSVIAGLDEVARGV